MPLRKAHVYRVYQTDHEGKIDDPNTWVDVMRIDRFTANVQRGSADGSSNLDMRFVVLWGDNTVTSNGTAQGPATPVFRKYTRLTLTDATDTSPKPATTDMPIIFHTALWNRGGQIGSTGQSVLTYFVNHPVTARKLKPLRITNNDLNDEIKFPKVLKGDPQPPMTSSKAIAWDDYVTALKNGLIDDSQYIDINVTDRFKLRSDPSPWDASGTGVNAGQDVTFVLVNKQAGGPVGVEDLFKAAPQSGDTGPPVSTDPFQVIVNVSWGGLAVAFGDKDTAPTVTDATDATGAT